MNFIILSTKIQEYQTSLKHFDWAFCVPGPIICKHNIVKNPKPA